MILTDKEIEQRALELYPVINDSTDPVYIKQDILFEQREIYKSTWKECTEYYRELIEDGMKWKELKNTLSSILEQYPLKERENNETKGWIAVNIYDILKSMTKKEIEW